MTTIIFCVLAFHLLMLHTQIIFKLAHTLMLPVFEPGIRVNKGALLSAKMGS